ncbi:MAG: tetratricopeptide repeat protein [Acidimicrobiales bacterium]
MGDERGVIRCRARLGTIAAMQGDFDEALPLLEESVRAHAGLGDVARTATSLANLGVARLLVGALEDARSLLEEALALHRKRGATLDSAQASISLGELELARGDADSARARFEEAAALGRRARAAHVESDALVGLATVAIRGGEVDIAASELAKAMQLSGGRALVLPLILERIAEVAIARGQYERGAELVGAAAARRENMRMPLPPVAVPLHRRQLDTLRDRLGPQAMAQALARGVSSVPTEGGPEGHSTSLVTSF